MARLEKKLDTQKTELADTVNKAVEKLGASLNNKIGCVNQRVNEIQTTLDDNMRVLRLKEIIISGIPVASNENLVQVFDSISMAIGFDRQCCYTVDNIFRMGNNKHNNHPSRINAPPILVRFTSLLLKNEFLQLYFKHRNLNLTHIGFNGSTDRVYINQNLTKTINLIYKAALKLKKSGSIAKIAIKSGQVLIIRNGSDSLVRVNSMEDLQFENSTSVMASNFPNAI